MRIGHPELDWNATTQIEDKARYARIRQHQNAQLQQIRAKLATRRGTDVTPYIAALAFGIIAAMLI